MRDIYIYAIEGGALNEFKNSLDLEKFREHGYNLPCTEQHRWVKPPPNSDCFVIGEAKTVEDILHCNVKELADNGCRVAMYYHEQTPLRSYDGVEWWNQPTTVMGGHSLKNLNKLISESDSYCRLMFLGDFAANYVQTHYPTYAHKVSPTTYFLGIGDGFKLKEQHNEKYDFFHFAWVLERRKSMLEELSKEFSIYPVWGNIYGADRTRAFEESKYILFLCHHSGEDDYPYWSWLRFNFAVMNDMPLFSERVVCEPLYTRNKEPSIIVPNKHFCEIPYKNVDEIKASLRDWLANPDRIEQVRENMQEFKKEEWSIPYRMSKLFDEVFP